MPLSKFVLTVDGCLPFAIISSQTTICSAGLGLNLFADKDKVNVVVYSEAGCLISNQNSSCYHRQHSCKPAAFNCKKLQVFTNLLICISTCMHRLL